MDQWNLRNAAAQISHLAQQSAQGGSTQQYSYSSNSYAGQQPQAPSSNASFNQQFLQQAAGQQIWRPTQTQQTDQQQTQSPYVNRIPAPSQVPTSAAPSANQYNTLYGVSQQQLLGVSSKATEYTGASRPAYVSSSSGVYDRDRDSTGYAGKTSSTNTDQYTSSTTLAPKTTDIASVLDQLQQVARAAAGGTASGLLASLSGVISSTGQQTSTTYGTGNTYGTANTAPGNTYGTNTAYGTAVNSTYAGGLPQSGGSYDRNMPSNIPSGGSYDRNLQSNIPSGGSYDRNMQTNIPSSGSYDRNVLPSVPSGSPYDRNVPPNVSSGGAYDRNMPSGNLPYVPPSSPYTGKGGKVPGGSYDRNMPSNVPPYSGMVPSGGSYGGGMPPYGPPGAYGARGVYPPNVGYGGVTLPPGRDYGTGRVSGGGSMFQRDRERTSTSSRFEERHEREREQREREERERERKERERERERREEERRREKSPARARRESTPPRRDDKLRRDSPRREPAQHRHASPSKDKRREYSCRIESSNLIQAERDYLSITRRYMRLYVSPEFSKFVLSWMGKEDRILLEKPISFDHDCVDVEDDPEVEETKEKPPKDSTVWNVRVMLMSGLSEECVSEFLSDKPTNFHKMVKFVALRKDRNAIMAAGARWDKSLDGGDPAVDDTALIRTAVRCLKEQIQVDLSECKDWLRFGEVHYERADEDGLPSHKEISVLLLPDLSGCLPSMENWTIQWNLRRKAKLERESRKMAERKEAEKEGDKDAKNGESKNGESEKKEDAKNIPKVDAKDTKEPKKEEDTPGHPGFLLTTKRNKTSKIRSMTISLDGLLDYDENDKDEGTFELSLFAEAFAEMLQYKKGCQILSSLESLRKTSHTRRREEKKRKQNEPGKEDAKRIKRSEDAPKAEDKQPSSEPPEETTEEQRTLSETDGPDIKEENPEEKNGIKKKDKKIVVDKELLKAYRFFDKNKVGYIKAEDMRKLIYSLGKCLSSRNVKDLVNCVVLETSKARDDRIMYRNLTDKEVVP